EGSEMHRPTESCSTNIRQPEPAIFGPPMMASSGTKTSLPWIGPFWNGTLIGKRSEEHTSELQSHLNLVCRLLLEKKKKKKEVSHRLSNSIDTDQHLPRLRMDDCNTTTITQSDN